MNKRLKLRLVLPGTILTYIIFMGFMIKTLHKVPLGCTPNNHVEINRCSSTRPSNTTVKTSNSASNMNGMKVRESLVSGCPLSLQGHGPGEGGYKVSTARINTTSRGDIDVRYGINTMLSDMISIHRKLKDTRPRECRFLDYPTNLPSVSVVILFRDEWPSVVLRTAYSVLESSAPDVLKEVVLVDDGSTNSDLKTMIDFHVDNVDKFKLIRNSEPLGLMKARDIGIKATTTNYFVVVDGHMEVGPGWLEPLLYRLVQQPKALLTPHVGKIDPNTFEVNFRRNYDQFLYFDIMSFRDGWTEYRSDFLSSRINEIDPIPFALYPGMMTVMRKDFYLQLGGFDTGMEVWGSEEIELSVKVWLCGGRVEMVPCSQAAHVYRPTPWMDPRYHDNRARNKARMREVWLDPPFRNFSFETAKHISHPTGDISDRLRIRHANKCKPFKYYVSTIRSFSKLYFPENPKESGVVYNAFYERCLAFDKETYKLSLSLCTGNISQYFILTENSEIRASYGRVLKTNVYRSSRRVELVRSPLIVKDQSALWRYGDDSTIINSRTGLCLTATSFDEAGIASCTNDILQIWFWKKLTEF